MCQLHNVNIYVNIMQVVYCHIFNDILIFSNKNLSLWEAHFFPIKCIFFFWIIASKYTFVERCCAWESWCVPYIQCWMLYSAVKWNKFIQWNMKLSNSIWKFNQHSSLLNWLCINCLHFEYHVFDGRRVREMKESENQD